MLFRSISMSDSRIAIDGMRDFLNAYRQLQDVQLGPTEEGKLQSFYSEEFLPNLSKLLEGEPQLGQYVPKTPASKYLQYHYIAANPNSYNEKSSLDSAVGDSTVYSATHKEYHPSFVRAAKIFGFDDLMLVDAKSLDIIYSYAKTTEFATSLDNGPYSNTKLARKVRELQTAQDRDVFKIADFEAYRPSLGKPMAFAMSPIFDESSMIGILVLQFPVDSFNKLMTGGRTWDEGKWKEEGLGDTGECYLVGPDLTMRSRSRFMMEDPQSYLSTLRKSSLTPNTVAQIERQGNT